MNTNIVDRTYYWIDKATREQTLKLARQVSRRHFLSKLGGMLVGIAALPLLPVSRSFAQDTLTETGDDQDCDYWRYCSMGGSLCTCCGGTNTSCPPGSEPSPISWVGTCNNPADDKDYLISYNDCCGKSDCNRCDCESSEGDRPVYYPANSLGIVWCFGTETRSYHCTVAMVLGEANDD